MPCLWDKWQWVSLPQTATPGYLATSRMYVALPGMGALLGGHFSSPSITIDMENKASALDSSLDFSGYGPAHRRRLRPTRRPLNDDLARNNVDATDALLDRATNQIEWTVPFVSRSCEICLQQKGGLHSPQPQCRTATCKEPRLWGRDIIFLQHKWQDLLGKACGIMTRSEMQRTPHSGGQK